MGKKIFLFVLAILMVSKGYAAWDFRGEPNNWGATRMMFVGANRHFIRQTFLAPQDEFKVAQDSGWAVSFPAQNFRVAAGKTFDITFFENTKIIQADEVTSSESWVFRGTTNNWNITPMTKIGAAFTICQTFGAVNPRFKISNGNKASWVESYPETDFLVAANSSVDITFTPATREIKVVTRTSSCGTTSTDINIDRSLFIHDQATLNFSDNAGPVFNLKRILVQLAGQLNAKNPARPTSANELFARMWDSQNETANAVFSDGPTCTGKLNGFPAECRFAEGNQARFAESAMNTYIPVALVNRFDLHDAAFSHCGEYRIIFARNDFQRNFIIFEAQLANPAANNPQGCLPIVKFWESLSRIDNDATRAQRLADFYFNGLANNSPVAPVGAVFDIANYASATGQIRTNEFMGNSWILKEFKVAIENSLSHIKPVSVKANPFGELFNETTRTDNFAAQFRTQFLKNMGSLLIADLATFSLTVENDAHNNGQSHASGDTFENDFLGNTSRSSQTFKTAIQSRATQLGSALTAEQIINRATAMTCAGCHNPGAFGLTFGAGVGPNQFWPQTLGFTHINENAFNGKFDISPALKDVFLPARKRGMENFLNSAANVLATQQAPILLKTNSLQAKPVDASPAMLKVDAQPAVQESELTLTGKRSG